jgi:acyl-CoA reductase-like NAD-dependent aldehyde dehydrogenase
MSERLNILKTYKCFINGQFPRTESGRYFELKNAKGQSLANVCLCSKKDLKNAVVAARNALVGWSTKSAFNRSQILYRLAEMLEGRKTQFVTEMLLQGFTKKAAEKEIELSIDRIVYYAGWCDKYQQIFSAVNPVASAHFNFSVPEPTGVVTAILPDNSPVLGLVSVLLPIIAGGNTCVLLASEKYPLSAITFSEVISTSDVPAGVVNILTGSGNELHPFFSSHMDVNALVYARSNKKEIKVCMENCSTNVKRFLLWDKDWTKEENQNPYLILDLQEIKTTWHPIDSNGVGETKY